MNIEIEIDLEFMRIQDDFHQVERITGVVYMGGKRTWSCDIPQKLITDYEGHPHDKEPLYSYIRDEFTDLVSAALTYAMGATKK